MNLDLVLDTSRKGIALGIYDSGKPLCERFEPESRGENLGRFLDGILQNAALTLDDIKRVLVTLGPGSFTGLRTGIAFCEGLCFSQKRSLFGVSTLRALRSLGAKDCVVVLFARSGFFYVGTSEAELFISVEDAVQKFAEEKRVHFVVDSRSAEEEIFQKYIREAKAEVVVSAGDEIAPFCRFFAELEPSALLRANYIQPSYYERRGAMGVNAHV